MWTLLGQDSPSSDACDVRVHRFWLIACLASGLQLVYHQAHTNQAESDLMGLYLFFCKKDCLTPDFFSIAESCSCVCNLLLTVLHVGVRTASVIIALTDGELQDAQFYYAEQEVSKFYVYPD